MANLLIQVKDYINPDKSKIVESDDDEDNLEENEEQRVFAKLI